MVNDKSLLVLGASSDLGLGLIREINEKYDLIIAHYRSESKELLELKEQLNDKLFLIQADFNREEDVDKLIQNIKEKEIAPTDIVHFSSAYAEQVRFHKQDWTSFQRLIDTSLKSVIKVLMAFLPIMCKKKYGRIVVMLSAYTLNVPPKFLSAYVTVKYALLGLVKSLAAEYAGKGITVNGVSPEMIETKFLANTPELVVQGNAQNSPIGRNLQVKDVIPTIEYLLSESATCITGQNIAITGGK